MKYWFIIFIFGIFNSCGIFDTEQLHKGCTDQYACNYDQSAQENDNSCIFPEGTCDCDGNPKEGYIDCEGKYESLVKIYVCLQGLDQVAVYNAADLSLLKTIELNFAGGSMMDTPHFISLDEDNGFWFVTNIMSGYVAQYDLFNDEFIDTVYVGDAPALLAFDPAIQNLFVSRMMPMGMMPEAISMVIQKINYSFNGLQNSGVFELNSPSPHGLAINSLTETIFTLSNTTDWIYKINYLTTAIEYITLDSTINYTDPSLELNRLKPIQAISLNASLLAFTCSGGNYFNSWTGDTEEIPGQVQLWDGGNMVKLTEYYFDVDATPWHLVKSPVKDEIYVVLSGKNTVVNNATAGLAALSFSDNGLELVWETKNLTFDTLHGVAVDGEGTFIYVSGRKDGNLHKFDAETGEHLTSIQLAEDNTSVNAGGVAVMQAPCSNCE